MRPQSRKTSGSQGRPGKPDEERRGGVSPFSDVLRSFLRESGLATQVSRASVTKAWRDACGPELARRTRILSFQNRELVIEVESAAHYQELKSFTGDHFVQLANKKLGSPRIRRARFQLKR